MSVGSNPENSSSGVLGGAWKTALPTSDTNAVTPASLRVEEMHASFFFLQIPSGFLSCLPRSWEAWLPVWANLSPVLFIK